MGSATSLRPLRTPREKNTGATLTIGSNLNIADHVHRFTSPASDRDAAAFDSFGGSAGKSVMISVVSPGTTSVVVVQTGGNSSTVILEVDY